MRLGKMQQQTFILSSILISSAILSTVICKPNNNNNNNNSQQQNLDKQLLRKALDQERASDSRTSGANPNNGDSSANVQGNGFSCPEQFGYYTDPKDCTKYYVCVFGEVLHETCTGGLRFSRELQTCDWPRNVDCPNQAASNDSSTTTTTTTTTATATATTPNQSSSPLPPTATTSTASSTTVSTTSTTTSSSSASSPISSTPPSTQSPQSSRSSSLASTTQHDHHHHHHHHDTNTNHNAKQSKSAGSSSMVFADEGSDPQQPSFDEAVSPVITADGAIHLHDGSGGTFSLTPNHNRALQTGSPQVQPASLASDHQPDNMNVFVRPILTSGSDNKLTNNKQQQTVQRSSSAPINNNNPKVLQPATLPNQRPNQRNQMNNNNNEDMNLMNMPRELQPTGGEFDSNGSSESEVEDAPANEPNGDQGENSSSVVMNGDNNANNNPSDSSELSSDYSSGDQLDNQPGELSGTQSGSYNPPLLAPNNNNHFVQPRGRSSPASTQPNGQQQASSQSSQLISINNRQIVDPTRQTFKPIIVTPSPAQLISSSQPIINSFNNNNNRESNQFSNQRTGHLNRHHNFNQQLPTLTNPNQRQNINTTFSSKPFNPTNLIQNSNNNAQANRPSRISNSNFQQNTNNINSNNQLITPPNQSGRFLNSFTGGQDSINSNLNFNDSSKLIRLQASQNNQFDSSASNTQANLPQHQQLGSNSFQPRFPAPLSSSSRSQNNNIFSSPVSLSFGFGGDQSGASATSSNRPGSSGNDNHNVPHDQLDGNQRNHLQQQTARNNNNNENDNNNLHPSASLPQLLQQQQQQQQRRPRPPKRQQIPSGGGGGGGGSGVINGRRANQLNDFIDATRPTTTSGSVINNNNFLAANVNVNANEANGNNNNNNEDDSEDDVNNGPLSDFRPGNGADQLLGAPTPPTRAVARPIVASTTVDFQSPNQQEGEMAGGFGATLSPPALSSPVTATTGSPSPTSQRQANGSQQRLRSSQGQAPVARQTTAASFGSTELPGELSTTAATATTPAGGSSAAPVAVTDGQANDPQLAANRYLNSAIDALEAGQPFGTVDYDFDILNDNSTERRQPGNSLTANNNQTTIETNFNLANNANNRQRQRQPQQQQTGEGINLTNGQPTSNQIGRNQQQGGRSRSNQQQGARQSSSSSSSGGGQQDAFVGLVSSGQQQTGAPSIQQPTSTSQQQQQQQQPTKKPRPTNKKINVNHEQALANNRASTEPARRPEAIYQTPTALQTASKCDNRICRLPDCKCGDTLNPGGLEAKAIPQVVLLTFDDAVNDLNWEIYEELFSGRTNPNGCPILATFYVSHEWTDYGQVQTLYSRGHEMASHSVTHSFGEKFSKNQWFKEINGQREILNMYGGVKMNDVRGMRAPFLQIGGNKMFEMLYDANFTYDSSMPIFENSPPLWPYTLDYQMTHECMITPCPTKSFPGVWEVGMTMWVDLRGGRCSMGDACSNPADEDGVYEMLMKNFNRHYKSNRAPFGLFYHSAWFNTVHHRRGFLRFLGTVNSLPDVFFVTNWQMLQWMRQPTPISEINQFEPWQCPAKSDRPPPCFHPSVCNVKSEHGTRFMKTCQPCPANQQYPWVGSTGFKGSNGNQKQSSSGSG